MEIEETIGLLLNSVVGLTLLGTIKLKGTGDDTVVVVMIDSSATHNFIAHVLMENLKT